MWVTDWRSLRDVFLKQSGRDPNRIALQVGGSEVSYGRLEETARQWASAMTRRLDRPPSRVGVLARRSEVAYVGVLAALCSGAAFVPLNPRFPKERTRLMIELGELDVVIVDATSRAYLLDLLPELARAPLILAPNGSDALPADAVIDPTSGNPGDELPPVLGDDIAYIMFTSGTTGTPKGVGVTHDNATHFMTVMSERYQFDPHDRCSQTFDLTFDLSVFDMFMTWGAGGTLVAMREVDLLAPVKFVRDNALTVWFSVPSVPAMIMKAGRLEAGSMPTLRWSLFCGEALPDRVAAGWADAAPNSTLENLYGPTELTIACCVYRWSPDRHIHASANGLVPIGRPLPGLGAVLLGEDGMFRSGVGEGELCACGPQTVPGYWRNPEQTAQRFVTLAVSADRPKRFYKTGDRVMVLPDGELAFLGRVDHQVKVSGYRVELTEIEAVIMQNNAVSGAVAIPFPIEDGSARGIVAFVIGSGVDPATEIARVRDLLPAYMVPGAVHVLEAFPLNANGKVDRHALAMEAETRARTA